MHPSSPPEGEPRDWARAIGPDIFDELKKLAFESESAATKLGAIKEILDRGYGRTPLASADASGDGEVTVIVQKDKLWTRDPAKAFPDPARR
jgi:hypothetical protein